MQKYIVVFLLIIILSFQPVSAQQRETNQVIIGSALMNNRSYDFLRKLCDEAGGRLVGSSENEKAMTITIKELETIGLQPKKESFKFPGWVRGDDEVMMLSPVSRKLRAVCLGYVAAQSPFEAPVVYAGQGYEESYRGVDVKEKIVLVTQEKVDGKAPLLRYEAIDIAAQHGARAILFINDHPGGSVLCGVSNFEGRSNDLPAYSLTFEEGKWLQRLCEHSTAPVMKLTTRSQCKELETANIVVTFPGMVKSKIVIGAHFDSWDVGQGAVDNGIGTAILFDVARLLQTHSSANYYTIELVWFNGEELGLWGSKNYLRMHGADDVAAMLNMDMTGTPTGFNTMGFDELIPFFKQLAVSLEGYDMKEGVTSVPSTNSDFEPFYLQGIPTISLQAHLDEYQYKYYHDVGDTFDKVNKRYLSDAAGVMTVVAKELANDRTLSFRHLTVKETIEMLKKHKLDERLKRQKEWPFKEN